VSLLTVDRPWRDYPLGTKAHAYNGGWWTRVEHGWRYGSRGGVFPTPADSECHPVALGRCIELPVPGAEVAPSDRGSESSLAEFNDGGMPLG
jgi:hypothetical protein